MIWHMDDKMIKKMTKILITIFFLILVGAIFWYNTNVYYAHEEGKLTTGWYLIFLLVPLSHLLIINYFITKRRVKT